MNPMLNIAIRAVRRGGDLLIQKYDIYKNSISNNKNHEKFIKHIVFLIQNNIIKIISRSYPDHLIISQDTVIENYLYKDQDIIWVINPIDGIENFKKKTPHFCTSIAIKIKHHAVISVIYDPIRNELFTAIKGKGAQLNGYRIRCSEIHNFSISSIAINDSFNKEIHLNHLCLKIINILINQKINFRCTGSSALDLAYVANGRFDFLLQFNFQPFFFEAGQLQIKESGALICDIKGGFNYFSTGIALIGNSKLLRLVLKKIYLIS